ncbi:citrate/2-methylcitrate synthase [Natronospora cellulosivora (SeqCode)]
MNYKIQELLKELKDPKVKEQYTQLIFTLLEKGYFPGLAGVPVVKSGVSFVDGKKGTLRYRGYPVQEIAEHCSYEDLTYLLLKGDLPLHEERLALKEQLLESRQLNYDVSKVIVEMDKDLHPMYMLSSAVMLLQGTDEKCFEVDNYHANFNRSVNLISKIPSIIGVFKNKYPYFAKEEDFDSFAQYCLYAYNEDAAENEELVNIFEKILILHADHTMNNSTFSVRSVASSKASIYASIASAINSLSGPLHGGANEKVIAMLEEISSPDNVEEYVNEKLEAKEKIMGIGHRVYKTYDPRALFLKNRIIPMIFGKERIIDIDSETEILYETAKKVEEVVLDKLSGKKLYPNVDFWSGLVLKAMGIDPSYFTTIFTLGRIMGWTAHWVEHLEVKNRIFRPYQLYDGMAERHIIIDAEEEIASSKVQ